MRSTLITPRRRGCPLCGHRGFARVGFDFFNRSTIFECNACRYTWAADHGPDKGTSLHRPQPVNYDDE
jgi:hypothetical protein